MTNELKAKLDELIELAAAENEVALAGILCTVTGTALSSDKSEIRGLFDLVHKYQEEVLRPNLRQRQADRKAQLN